MVSHSLLFREGVILNRHYVHTKCSPSRAALLTGRYAWKMGRQRGAIERFQPTGLSTKYELLPQMLKKAGYDTQLYDIFEVPNEIENLQDKYPKVVFFSRKFQQLMFLSLSAC